MIQGRGVGGGVCLPGGLSCERMVPEGDPKTFKIHDLCNLNPMLAVTVPCETNTGSRDEPKLKIWIGNQIPAGTFPCAVFFGSRVLILLILAYCTR